MTLKQAIIKARKDLAEVFDLDSENIFLEEVQKFGEGWKITLSFYEKPRLDNHLLSSILAASNSATVKRYKIVTVDRDGELLGIEKHDIDR